MTESPETPTPSLAERIDVFLAAPGVSDATSDDLLRAAAAQLRQLDRIKAVVRASRCPWLGLGYEEPGCGECGLCRIADALEADDGA